jgi:hypothetical protein
MKESDGKIKGEGIALYGIHEIILLLSLDILFIFKKFLPNYGYS